MRPGHFTYLFILMVLGFTACKVPVTERRQVRLYNERGLQRSMMREYRRAIIYGELAAGTEEDIMVKSVGLRLQRAYEDILTEAGKSNRLDHYKWEFQVLVDEKPVIYAIPGGKVMVYTGLMPICKDEEGVAAAMGHELGHIMARHYNEAGSKRSLAEFGADMLLLGLSDGHVEHSVTEYTYWIATRLDQSKEMQLEADRIGLILMARAGYNPDAVLEYLSRYDSMLETGISNYNTVAYESFRTSHHQDSLRMAVILNELLPEARMIYQDSLSRTIQ